MLYKTAEERYQKLRAQFKRLMVHFDRDGLDNFIQTAHSLKDWIQQDSTLNQHQQDELRRFTIPNGIDWQFCAQIANFQKHARLSSPRHKSLGVPTLMVKDIRIIPGSEPGVFFPSQPQRTFGTGDAIVIDYEADGKQHSESAFGFVCRTFQFFYYIFELAPITSLPERIKDQKNWVELMSD